LSDATDAIAIVGIGCRFPGGVTSPAMFWRLLLEEREVVGDVPASRWPVEAYYDPDAGAPGKTVSRRGGFLDDVAGFDAGFFGISPREAADMDPQQRLALELAWEALEDAGIRPRALRDSETGVYQGIKFNDYELLKTGLGAAAATPFTSTGTVEGLIANRVSHFLGLRGPSMTVNASCAASLVAVHLACQALRTGECELALAGAVQLNLAPETAVALSKLGTLSPDGRCRTFDAGANGYVRSEGGAVVVLKPRALAERDGDHVYGVILGTATNNNGPNPSLPASSASGQEHLLRLACRRAGVDPASVDYVEAHGTGTVVGDPVELTALGAVYGSARDDDRPLLVGSVKTNLGHLEAAAGMAGLVKLALCLEAGVLPRSLHFERPNPAVDLDALRLRVAALRQPWPEVGDRRRRGGVSAFGFGGSNAHAILEAPAPRAAGRRAVMSARPRLLVVSARTPAALAAQAAGLHGHLARWPERELDDVAYTAGRARTHFEERLALVADTTEEACERLAAFVSDPRDGSWARASLTSEAVEAPAGPGVAFVFSGQGADGVVAIGRELLEREPAFRAAIERCAAEMPGGRSVLDVLGGAGHGASGPEVDVAQPAVFAFQVGLVALLRHWGVRPSAVVGADMSEVAAAHVAGAIDLAAACRVVCRVSVLADELSAVGGTGSELPRYAPDTIRAMARDGCRAFVEVGPEALLAAALREALRDEPDTMVTSTVRPETGPTRSLMEALGALHCHGVDLDWRRLYPDASTVPLPTYAFQRERHWAIPAAAATAAPAAPPVAEPRPPVESNVPLLERVAGEVASVLGVPSTSVGPDVSFERLGMDSRMATELRQRLTAGLGLAISSGAVWGHPTVRKLAAHVEALSARAKEAIPEAERAPVQVPAAPLAAAAAAADPSEDELIRLGEQLLGL
jgi:acyl transferase domain-containing protein